MIDENQTKREDVKKISEMAKALRLPEDRFRNLVTSDAKAIDYKNAREQYEREQEAVRITRSREENKTGTLEEFGGGNGLEY